jgi:non-canonical purine NTP pyrophosphatase (RdgB/HAM1 family)
MKQFIYVSGNKKKSEYLSHLLGLPVECHDVDLDEIQTLDINKLVEHKARQAYKLLNKPVLVEDQSLIFNALDGLPGPFIKFFVSGKNLNICCRMLDGFKDRSARAESTFGYYDGETLSIISSGLNGKISDVPKGEGGFGWDPIFIPEGYDKTRAELVEEEDYKVFLKIKPIIELRKFLAED